MAEDSLGFGWLGLAIVMICLAIFFYFWAAKRRASLGLPGGQIRYNDTGTYFASEEPLFSSRLGLVGKPDYLVQERPDQLIPVEVKSSRAPIKPYDGHVLQLAAYCLLVEDVYGMRPEYGILQYRDQAFAIKYSRELEEDLLDLLAEMHEDLFENEIDRDHEDWGRCANCGLRDICQQRLE